MSLLLALQTEFLGDATTLTVLPWRVSVASPAARLLYLGEPALDAPLVAVVEETSTWLPRAWRRPTLPPGRWRYLTVPATDLPLELGDATTVLVIAWRQGRAPLAARFRYGETTADVLDAPPPPGPGAVLYIPTWRPRRR